MSETPFHSLPADVRRIAKEARIMFLRYECHEPTVRAVFGDSSIATIPVGHWMNDVNTKILIQEVMVMAVRAKARSVGLISEIWMKSSLPTDKKTVRAAIAGRLHEVPDREEALMVTVDTETMTYLLVAKINRGKKLTLDPWICTAVGIPEFEDDAETATKMMGENMNARFQSIWQKSKRWTHQLHLERIIAEHPELDRLLAWLKNA